MLVTGYCTFKIRTIPYYARRDIREEPEEVKPEKHNAKRPSHHVKPAGRQPCKLVEHRGCKPQFIPQRSHDARDLLCQWHSQARTRQDKR